MCWLSDLLSKQTPFSMWDFSSGRSTYLFNDSVSSVDKPYNYTVSGARVLTITAILKHLI